MQDRRYEFNPERYHAKRSILSDDNIRDMQCIMDKVPMERTEQDVKVLSILTDAVDVLHKMGDMQRQVVFRILKFKEFKPNEVVVAQKDMCNVLYVLIKGKCDILVYHEELEEILKSSMSKKNASRLQNLKSSSTTKMGEHTVLHAFGNVQLVPEGMLQSASIVAREHCSFVCIDAKQYDIKVHTIEPSMQNDQIAFLQKRTIFASCPVEELSMLSSKMILRTFHAGTCLIKQGEKQCDLYIVKIGLCRIIKFYGDMPIDYGEVGRGAVIGEQSNVTSKSSMKSQDYAVLANTHLQVYVVPRKVAYGLITTCNALRAILTQPLRKLLTLEEVKKNVADVAQWNNSKRNIVQEFVPSNHLVPKKPTVQGLKKSDKKNSPRPQVVCERL